MPTHPAEAPGPDLIVADVLQRWPETLHVFIKRRMACPGCPMAGFMTVAEAAQSYGYDSATLVRALADAAQPSSG